MLIALVNIDMTFQWARLITCARIAWRIYSVLIKALYSPPILTQHRENSRSDMTLIPLVCEVSACNS